ncbi:MAG: hypothetical protein U5N86_12645 [Planctomycetota bacterium]|nr:hypothetical protein [Planctomycetota bacterium]
MTLSDSVRSWRTNHTFNIYGSRGLYRQHAREEKPGSGDLGGFYSDGEAHFFIEADYADLAYEDLAVKSMNYLAPIAYLNSISNEVPQWVETGVGQYFQDSRWHSARKIFVGEFPNRYSHREFVKGLASGKVFDPQRIMKSDSPLSTFDHYSAWAIVTYCMDSGDRTLKALFLKCIENSVEHKDAFRAFEGRASTLKKEVPAYIKSLEPPLITLEVEPYPMF